MRKRRNGSKYEELEKRTQLHEEIRIYYTVDGFKAEFVTGDERILASAHEVTIQSALEDLEIAVKALPEKPSEFRKTKFRKSLNSHYVPDGGETCDFCGEDIGSYGTSKCPKCGETKCCAQCIPAGVGTSCIDCEEND